MDEAAPSFLPVAQQLERLRRGVVELVREEELHAKLERSRASRRPLTVKVGFDPTAPDLHLGHTVLLRKMRQFQDLGHRVIFVVGDFTARIGDPSGRSETRPPLSEEQILQHAETYKAQCLKILDPQRTEIRFNSEWLKGLDFEGVLRLASQYTVARMLERKDFKTRFDEGRSIAIHEFLYPLAQAYDSVVLRADVELGGADQLFNLLVGRDVMAAYGLEPQVVMTVPLLEGLDGVQKMSKSFGNYVGITEPPQEIFGKIMSISDELMWRYYELCTDLSPEGLAQMQQLVRQGRLHPKRAKEGLGMRIVADFHGEQAAQRAYEEFQRVFAAKGLPETIAEHRYPAGEGRVFVPRLLAGLGLVSSHSEAMRLVRQRAVEWDGEVLAPDTREVEVRSGETHLIKVGKRRFARVHFD